MIRILVVPERLRELSDQLQRAAGELRGLYGRTGNAIGSLDWEARQKAGVDGQVSSARSRAMSLADQAESMGRFLSARALAFEEADRQGVTDIEGIEDKYPIPIVSLPSLGEVFDVLKASLSTLTLLISTLGLQAAKVLLGAVDFFARKLPQAEKAFRQWEDYNRQEDWDRATSDQYREEARKALEDLGVAGLKDTLDAVVDKVPKTDSAAAALKKAYDSVGAIDDWINAVGSKGHDG